MKTKCATLAVLMLLTLAVLPAQAETVYTPEEAVAYFHQIGMQLKALGIYPFVALDTNQRGYEVLSLQARLSDLNYYQLPLDGIYGQGTLAAMALFERINGLKRDGLASVEDQMLLFSETALANPQAINIAMPEATPKPTEKVTAKPPRATIFTIAPGAVPTHTIDPAVYSILQNLFTPTPTPPAFIIIGP